MRVSYTPNKLFYSQKNVVVCRIIDPRLEQRISFKSGVSSFNLFDTADGYIRQGGSETIRYYRVVSSAFVLLQYPIIFSTWKMKKVLTSDENSLTQRSSFSAY